MKTSRSNHQVSQEPLALRLLSFDTSTAELHIALAEGGRIVSQEIVRADAESGAPRQEAAAVLMPTIDRLVKAQAWSKSDLDAIVVGSGPGSFTGIRTSVVTARALAQALDLPLISVSLLDCLADQVADPSAIVLWATAGFYFLGVVDCQIPAAQREGRAKLSYVNEIQLGEALAVIPTVYVDAQARAALEPLTHVLSGKTVLDLPGLENLAVRQSQVAWNRLSLKILPLCEKLWSNIESDDSDEQKLRLQLRSDVRQLFPYEAVTPTYLRSPSVTVKKTNG